MDHEFEGMKSEAELEMKHFVLGFVFNRTKTNVLLIEKKRPAWQAGHWNGIGGKIKMGENPLQAMIRERIEETRQIYDFKLAITFVCPGGTVFVFKAVHDDILFEQVEDERLAIKSVDVLPHNVMANLKWLIPLCLSTVQKPVILYQNTLGVE